MTELTDIPVNLGSRAADMIGADADFAGFVIDALKTFADAITAGDIADYKTGDTLGNILGSVVREAFRRLGIRPDDGPKHFMKFTDKNGIDLFLQKFPDGIAVMVAADFKN